MKIKNLVWLLCCILLFSAVSASDYLPHKINTQLEFSITSNEAISCNVTSYDYPLGFVTLQQIMTRNGQTFNATIDKTNFTSIGDYCFNIVCSSGTAIETGSVCRDVTPSGDNFTMQQALLIVVLYIFIILLLLISLYLIFFSETFEWVVGGISSTYIMLFTLVFITWLFMTNYFSQFAILGNILWILWLILGFGFLPFIAGLSFYIILRGFNQKNIESLQTMGYTRDEATALSKNR